MDSYYPRRRTTIDVCGRQRTRTRVAGSLSSSISSYSKILVVSTILLGFLFLSSAVEAFQFHDVRQATAKHNHRFTFTSSSRLHSTPPPGGSTEQQQDPGVFPVVKSDQEWKEILTPDQYYILRKEGTETPGASVLNNVSVEKNGDADAGTFCCAGCQNPLFLASSKYDSGTGWPSFFCARDGFGHESQHGLQADRSADRVCLLAMRWAPGARV
mmetsp:Transcript_27576/g.59386  ORF Transcript_27576/g.59386 Transcript_27576/m.59386 type:complete len:214 (+) Transcript_27576:191-832(+)